MRTPVLPALVLVLWTLTGCPAAADDDDTAGDDDAASACADQAPLDQVLALDPDGDPTQIHVDADLDGDVLWLAYNTPRPDAASQTPGLASSGSGFVVAGSLSGPAGDASIAAAFAPAGAAPDIALQLGDAGALNHGPALATAPGGPALLWYRHVSGLDNELLAARLVDDGSLTAGAPRSLRAEVPPYPVALVHVGGDVFFAAWSEGDNPDYMIQGMFLELGED